jgi:ligand-binding sensor domain-containing protein
MINKTAALVLLVLLSSHFAWGQTFFTEQLSTKNGLSSNHVTCITQDKFGTLWIGTANGLNRYDGYRVKVYHHNPWDSLTLPFHQVDFLFADSKGGIWALSGNTVAYLAAGEVHFKVLQLTTNEVAYAVNEDNKNNIYIGSNQAFYVLEDGK